MRILLKKSQNKDKFFSLLTLLKYLSIIETGSKMNLPVVYKKATKSKKLFIKE